jgi:glutamine---fructose-6-phosphate transaminase (isomerizing)
VTTKNKSYMLREALEAPTHVATQIELNAEKFQAFVEHLDQNDPTAILTIARGSSDHAAHFAAYLLMATTGRLVTSLPMSLITLHHTALRCQGLMSIAFSQSGQSPDLIVPTRYFREHGATTLAFVNDSASPLSEAAEWSIPLRAGTEQSVAATKSFIAQLVAGAQLAAYWSKDVALSESLRTLPLCLTRAASLDWSHAVKPLETVNRLFVVSRGSGLAVAMEAALKFKETCGIQAEAFSGAEIRHGPMALVEEGYPILIFAPRGPSQAGLLTLAADMRERGASVLLATSEADSIAGVNLLPVANAADDRLDPISIIQSFYPMVEALARARGRDPDAPRHLTKVTKTR